MVWSWRPKALVRACTHDKSSLCNNYESFLLPFNRRSDKDSNPEQQRPISKISETSQVSSLAYYTRKTSTAHTHLFPCRLLAIFHGYHSPHLVAQTLFPIFLSKSHNESLVMAKAPDTFWQAQKATLDNLPSSPIRVLSAYADGQNRPRRISLEQREKQLDHHRVENLPMIIILSLMTIINSLFFWCNVQLPDSRRESPVKATCKLAVLWLRLGSHGVSSDF